MAIPLKKKNRQNVLFLSTNDINVLIEYNQNCKYYEKGR